MCAYSQSVVAEVCQLSLIIYRLWGSAIKRWIVHRPLSVVAIELVSVWRLILRHGVGDLDEFRQIGIVIQKRDIPEINRELNFCVAFNKHGGDVLGKEWRCREV
jgi:hypothetical protein